MIYYEILNDGTIGRSTSNIKIVEKEHFLNINETENESNIVYGYDGKRYLAGNEPQKPLELIEQEQNEQRKIEIQARLNELSQDFLQVFAGAIIEDIEDRKAEFETLHNELRQLLGKEPRQYEN